MNITLYSVHKNKLKGEYLEAFEKIENYCKLELMDSESFSDSMDYLIDVFLTAQSKGTPVKKITGGSIEKFCKSFHSDINPKGIIRDIFHAFTFFAWYMLITIFIFDFTSDDSAGGFDFWIIMGRNSNTLLSALIGMLLGAIGGLTSKLIVRKLFFKFKKYRSIYHTIISIIVSAVFIVAFVFPMLLLENTINIGDISIGASIVICTCYLICYYIIRGFSNKASGKKFFENNNSNNKISFSSSVINAMVDECRKQYKKKNAKLIKKNKAPLTEDEYNKKFLLDTKKAGKYNIITAIILAIIYIGFIAYVAVDSTVFDTLIFAAILMILYVIIMWTIFFYPYMRRKQLAQIIEKNKISLFDDRIIDIIKANKIR